tara:strand:- start:1 stop:594 length:594 start_codon:yes stop_codon:yes gene_type:complete
MTGVTKLASFIVDFIKSHTSQLQQNMDHVKNYITEINDFPTKGIAFKDINPIYKKPKIWQELMLPLEELINKTNVDLLAGIESRGFITASALAYKLNKGFLAIRKPNKLPGKILGLNYQLEYGEDRLEIQLESINRNCKIIVVDDLLATGGTASTAGKLIQKAGGNLIGYAFLVELTSMKGRNKLDKNLVIDSVLKY